jgi:hypothetical protein
MLIDVTKKRNEQTEQAELLMGATSDRQTHMVTAELEGRGRGPRDRDSQPPGCPETPTLKSERIE